MEVCRDADGTLRGYSDFLRLDICVRPDGLIRLYDPASGEWLSSHDEAVDERDEAASQRDEIARQRDIANAALRERDARLRESNAALRERDAEIERLRAALRAQQ